MDLHSQDSCRARFASIFALIWLTIFTAPSFAQDATATRLSHAVQFLSAGNLDRAEVELQRVLRAAPKEYRALDLLGVVRILQRRQIDAETLFQRAIQSKPDFASAHAHLGLPCRPAAKMKLFPNCKQLSSSIPLAPTHLTHWCTFSESMLRRQRAATTRNKRWDC
jgi:predicted Zn-dependent protease